MSALRLKRILLIDDDRQVHEAIKHSLRGRYECLSAYTAEEARVVLASRCVDAIILDLSLERQNDGLELLPALRELECGAEIIIMSGNTEVQIANQAIAGGASAYLLKDCSVDQLVLTIEAQLQRRELRREAEHHARERARTLAKQQLIGKSPAIVKLKADLAKIARSPANLLILAETGCGKELVARHIGAGQPGPFVAVDSATITSSMAESILFGHEKGAFTGAHQAQKGLFEEANGGVIYFDEIANMPLDIQAKLLRVLQEKEVKRVGASKLLSLEFRVICATNRDLDKLVAEGKFLGDFLQRLNVLELRIAPLRERTEDLDLLVPHFFALHRMPGSATALSPDALATLKRYSWPGNARELSNVIANLCAMVIDQELVEVEDLPCRVRAATTKTIAPPPPGPGAADLKDLKKVFGESGTSYYSYMDGLERNVLSELYRLHDGNVPVMSRELKVSRSHLYTKLKAHQIHN